MSLTSFLALAPDSMVQSTLKAFNDVIQEANRRTLKPKRAPDLNGARWWNDTCSMAHMLARSAPDGNARRTASAHLKRTVIATK